MVSQEPGLFGPQQANEGLRSLRQLLVAAEDQEQVALQPHFSDAHFRQFAALGLHLHAHARHDRHTHSHFHETLDAFDGGKFDADAQRHAVFGEELDYALPVWRSNNVRDKILTAQFVNRNAAVPG